MVDASKARMKQAWKANSGFVAWPTILLGVAVVSAHIALWFALDRLPTALVVALSTLVAYLAFTVLHEASHGNIHGRDSRLRVVSSVLGWTNGALLVAPFPAFRIVHNQHHSHTNHPDKDPDIWVAGSAWTVVFRCFTIVPHYYVQFLVGEVSRTKAGRENKLVVVSGVLALIGLASALGWAGFGQQVVFVWLLPAFLASGVLAFLFDWVPHQPHNVQGRYRDTRAIPIRGLGLLTLGQNLHLVHHLFPRVPFYRYHKVFGELRNDLAAKGAPIYGDDVLPNGEDVRVAH